MKETQSRLRILTVTLVMLAVTAVPAAGVTTADGYSSFMTEYRSSQGGDPSWQFANPQLYAELAIKSSPWQDISTYLKMSAESNRLQDDLKDTRFFLREAHMRYRWDHLETHIFGGQNRFWLGEPLLDIINQDVVKQDDYGPRAQGIRVDFWGVYGLTGAAFLSERSDYFKRVIDDKFPDEELGFFPDSAVGDTITSRTDDYRALRIYRAMSDQRVNVGVTYGRKDFTRYGESTYHGRRRDYDEAYAIDLELALGDLVPTFSRFGRVTWITEYGRNSSGWKGELESSRPDGFKTELRNVRVGPILFVGSYEDYGTNFYNDGIAAGDRRDLNDYSQYYIEGRYRVPTKAINLKYWKRHAEPEHPGSTSYSESTGEIDEWGTEAYLEFVNGFTGKVEYKMYEDNNGIWPNLFFEVTGENRLVKLRTQLRIRDIDSDFEVTAYGFEANVNLTEKWKFYARVMNVDEHTESRQTAFGQLRYLGWSGAEFFIEFGNPDHSNDLVNDGDFVSHDSGAITDKVFKAFLRIYY
jgi:hypothetical protein